ncbi:MAG TPA: nucleotide disphospho-sugar-binding domain-containing protein [Roseiflexaceae bacterium]|nr:nucleotide disphospho-sugar-binding domain-containing protein [Roseiflexaceae bacterium]
MKALFTTNPGIGHFLPMVPVARALERAGHEVRFATSRLFHPTVERYGLRAIAAGLPWAQADATATFPELAGLSPSELANHYLGDIFADVAAHAMVPDLLEIARDWQPDIIVRNDFEFGSCVAAEVLDIPQATVSICFYLEDTMLEPMIGDQLAYLRSAHGLAPYPPLEMRHRGLYLSFTTAGFQPCVRPGMHALRPIPLETTPAGELPDWFADMPERPLVYMSLSSVYHVPSLLPTVLEGLRDEPVNLIVTIGRGQDPAQYGPQPPHIHIVPFIPQAALFPHCDLFITHSPFATMMAALNDGVPLLITPFTGESPVGARRAQELEFGLALRLAGHSSPLLPPGLPELSPATVRAACRELIGDPKYRANARRIQQELALLPGPEHTVALLEQCAAACAR